MGKKQGQTRAPDDMNQDPEAGAGGERDRALPAGGDEPEPAAGANGEVEAGELDEQDGAGEVERMREALLRTHAEMDNLRKRTARDLEKSRKFILEGFIRDLLPVIDALDQGLVADTNEDNEGLRLTRKQLLKVLAEHGLEPLDPHGETFDPRWHEAISMQPSEQFAADTVIQVLQKGYRLYDRLLRPARVIVSREPTRAEGGADAGD